MGEVLQKVSATKAEAAAGTLGTIDIEGAKSQEVDEALVSVTRNTTIVDEHDPDRSAAGFDAIKERQTVQVSFDLLSENPWKAVATKVVILP